MKCSVTDFDRLHHLMKQSSSAIGFLARDLLNNVLNVWMKLLDEVLGGNVQPWNANNYGL